MLTVTEALDICADLAVTPGTQCPKCLKWQDDFDGFGVLKCEHCDYCSHPSITDGICGLCGICQPDGNRP